MQHGMYRKAGLDEACSDCWAWSVCHFIETLVWFKIAGQTGSFLNLAPEVALNRPYNEKCDVSSADNHNVPSSWCMHAPHLRLPG